ncbi:MAG: hypothetical protein ACRD0C_16860 [Acidimicrobiia bacterium]
MSLRRFPPLRRRPVRVEDGHVAAREVSGAGVEWDEAAVRRFAL